MAHNILSKLFYKILLQEKIYLIGTLILFSALYFLISALFITKDIFSYYVDSKTMILPHKLVITDENLSSIKEKMQKSNPALDSKYLIGSLKTYYNTAIYNSINKEKSLPKSFTLLSFDIPLTTPKVTLRCNAKIHTVEIKNIHVRHHKHWIFKTSHIPTCKRGDTLELLTQERAIPVRLRKNSSSARLVYKMNPTYDPYMYKYLIGLAQNNFLHYFPFSKFYLHQRDVLTKEAQENAKMLHAYFQIIFAHKRQKVLLNQNFYDALVQYKKIKFTIEPYADDFTKPLFVSDTIPLDLQNTHYPIEENLILANLSSLSEIHYQTHFIYIKDASIDLPPLKNARIIDKKDFNLTHTNYAYIPLVVAVLYTMLLALSIALNYSFVSRVYNRYKDRAQRVLFFNTTFMAATFVIGTISLFAIGIASLLSYFLLDKINAIFNIYYLDLIHVTPGYLYMMLFFAINIAVIWRFEKQKQKQLMQSR